MSDEKALSIGKNGADKLVLQEIHFRLDWVSSSPTKIHHMEALKKKAISRITDLTTLKSRSTELGTSSHDLR